MMKTETKVFYPVARALLGTLFFISGISKITGFGYVAGWMSSAGLPAAELLLAITIAIEVLGGLMLITGYKAHIAASVIALFLVPTTLIFHAFWNADAAGFQNELTQFLKNLAILGGMLLVIDRERPAIESRVTAAPSRAAKQS
ncbi:DoxX family protein [Oxalobacteraceae bacterium R-40]|uniref:DoxX family protein n=1 Tax=Keguizhuia sedimenti TaxID=3064264 RepID=A0ABU1BW09_9BURK|nr:DoxX family protein [Oxalobacteraceae bacterium R-40]